MINKCLRRAGLACLFAAPLVFALPFLDSNTNPSPNRNVPARTSSASGALKVHIDPATGRIIPPPPQAAPDPAADARFPSTHDGLVEEPGTTAAGGFKVDTRGRFRSAVTLQVGPDGKPTVACSDGTNGPLRPRE